MWNRHAGGTVTSEPRLNLREYSTQILMDAENNRLFRKVCAAATGRENKTHALACSAGSDLIFYSFSFLLKSAARCASAGESTRLVRKIENSSVNNPVEWSDDRIKWNEWIGRVCTEKYSFLFSRSLSSASSFLDSHCSSPSVRARIELFLSPFFSFHKKPNSIKSRGHTWFQFIFDIYFKIDFNIWKSYKSVKSISIYPFVCWHPFSLCAPWPLDVLVE